MKNNYTKTLLLLVILFFCLGIYAINDTVVHVKLEKSQNDSIIAVDLSFYNNSNNTIILFSRFEHFLYEMQTNSGFMILFYVNGEHGMPLWGEVPKTNYVFSKRFLLIKPKGKVKFEIPLNDYLGKRNPKNKYDVQFIVNYFYKRQNSSKVEYILNKETNILRVN